MKVNLVQIAVSSETNEAYAMIAAVDDQGRLWTKVLSALHKWELVEGPEEPE